MRAFEVYLNGKRVSLAGIGDDGVLTAIVGCVTAKGRRDLFLEVGGKVSPADEHVAWINHKPLRLGDQLQIKLVEATTVDEPTKRHRY